MKVLDKQQQELGQSRRKSMSISSESHEGGEERKAEVIPEELLAENLLGLNAWIILNK